MRNEANVRTRDYQDRDRVADAIIFVMQPRFGCYRTFIDLYRKIYEVGADVLTVFFAVKV